MDLNSSIRLSIKKVQNARNEYLHISEDTLPQDTTQKVASWRNSIDSLQKDLNSHGNFLKNLRKEAPSSNNELSQTSSLIFKISEKFTNDFKVLINILKANTHLPKTCVFNNWELILQNICTEIAKLTSASVTQSEEGVLEILYNLYELKESLTGQIFKAMLYKKIVL